MINTIALSCEMSLDTALMLWIRVALVDVSMVLAIGAVVGALGFLIIALRVLAGLSRDRIRRGHSTARQELAGWANTTAQGALVGAGTFAGVILGWTAVAITLFLLAGICLIVDISMRHREQRRMR